DGIRVFHVTGVQTCALPILHRLADRVNEYADHISEIVARYLLAEFNKRAVLRSPAEKSRAMDSASLCDFILRFIFRIILRSKLVVDKHISRLYLRSIELLFE